MDAGFERLDRDIRELRGDFRDEMGTLRSDLGGQIEALRQTMLHVGGGMLVGLLGVIAAILATS